MKYKIKKWIFNYLFYGYFISLIMINIYFVVKFQKLNFSWQILRGNFLFCLVVMPLSMGFKGVYYEYKDWYNESGLLGKIIMFLGLGFVLYGVYSRAKMSGSFK